LKFSCFGLGVFNYLRACSHGWEHTTAGQDRQCPLF
jgi:hypothetical protein